MIVSDNLSTLNVSWPIWNNSDYGNYTGYRVCFTPEVIPLISSTSVSHIASRRDIAYRWRHNEPDGFSNHRVPIACLNVCSGANKTRHQSVTDLCEGNPPATDGFPSQRASNAEKCPFDDVIIENRLPTASLRSTRYTWLCLPANNVMLIHIDYNERGTRQFLPTNNTA